MKIVSGIILAIAIFRFPQGAFLKELISVHLIIDVVFKMGATLILAVHVAKINRWAAAMLALGAISLTHPVYTQLSDTTLFVMVLMAIIYSAVQEGETRYLYYAMMIFSMFHLVACIYQLFGVNMIGMQLPEGRIEGLMANPNGATTAFALCLPAFFKYPWLLFIPIAGLSMTHSSGGAIASVLAFGVYYFNTKWRNWVIAGAVVSLCLFFCFLDHPNVTERLYCWGRALPIYLHGLDMKFQHILGVGIGNWPIFNKLSIDAGNITPGWVRMHNVFIQGFMEMGPLFIIITLGYITSLRKLRDPLLLSALAAIFVVCMVNSIFHMNAVNGMFIMVWLGLIARKLKNGTGYTRNYR